MIPQLRYRILGIRIKAIEYDGICIRIRRCRIVTDGEFFRTRSQSTISVLQILVSSSNSKRIDFILEINGLVIHPVRIGRDYVLFDLQGILAFCIYSLIVIRQCGSNVRIVTENDLTVRHGGTIDSDLLGYEAVSFDIVFDLVDGVCARDQVIDTERLVSLDLKALQAFTHRTVFVLNILRVFFDGDTEFMIRRESIRSLDVDHFRDRQFSQSHIVVVIETT